MENSNMNWMMQKLYPHVGHDIVCVAYGDPREPDDVCIECETCCCVLISCEDFEEDTHDCCHTIDEVSKTVTSTGIRGKMTIKQSIQTDDSTVNGGDSSFRLSPLFC